MVALCLTPAILRNKITLAAAAQPALGRGGRHWQGRTSRWPESCLLSAFIFWRKSSMVSADFSYVRTGVVKATSTAMSVVTCRGTQQLPRLHDLLSLLGCNMTRRRV